MLKLTVLGCYAPFPGPGQSCPGYLLEWPAAGPATGARGEADAGAAAGAPVRVLLDCGSGSLQRLMGLLKLGDLTAVVLSHLHFDHMADFLVLRYALEIGRRLGWRQEPLPVFAPPEPAAPFGLLSYRDLTQPVAVTPGQTVKLGPVELTFFATRHTAPCVALRASGGGAVFAYTADTEYTPELLDLARDADLLLSEASLPDEAPREPGIGHLTAGEAGRLAAEAGARRLVITHLFPYLDPMHLKRQAEATFGRPVEVASDGATFEVGGEA